MGCSGGKQAKSVQVDVVTNKKLCPICDENWLIQATSPSGDAFCNICESEFRTGDFMYGCRDCDYDECGVCFVKAFYLPFKVNDVPVVERQGGCADSSNALDGDAYIVDLAGLTSQDVTLPDPGDDVEVMETFWSNDGCLCSTQLFTGEIGLVTKDDGEDVGGDGSVKVKFNSQEEVQRVLPENFKNLKVLGKPRKLGYRNSMSMEDQSGRAALHSEIVYGTIEKAPDGVEWLKIGDNVKEAPELIVVKEENCFLVTLEKVSGGAKIGLITVQLESKYLAVETIKEGGLVADWNAANPEVQILLKDIVVAVNDTSGDSKAMLGLFKTTGTLTLKVIRADGAPPAVAPAPPAPVPEPAPEPKEPEVPVEPEAATPTTVEPPQVIEAVAVPLDDEANEVPADTSKRLCCF